MWVNLGWFDLKWLLIYRVHILSLFHCCWCWAGQRENKPNYTHIFNSETLQRIAAQLPITVAELAAVEGVAAVKAERYGQEFLDITMNFTCRLTGNHATSIELVWKSDDVREAFQAEIGVLTHETEAYATWSEAGLRQQDWGHALVLMCFVQYGGPTLRYKLNGHRSLLLNNQQPPQQATFEQYPLMPLYCDRIIC